MARKRAKIKKELEIVLFSEPTEGHLLHYWAEAQKLGIKQARFETLWFEAYNKFKARQAQELFSEKRFEIAGLLIEKGQDAKIRNTGRAFLNFGLEKLEKELETKLPRLKLEEVRPVRRRVRK